MIKAMRLTEVDYYISSLQFSDVEDIDLLFNEIQFFKPELIITLGATASNKILNSNERLKDCHGQISKVSISDETKEVLEIAVMPLFSPTLLQTAPNMKKTAWKDMQKAMEYLNL
jgi:uracil-DNA glycosylase family 4